MVKALLFLSCKKKKKEKKKQLEGIVNCGVFFFFFCQFARSEVFLRNEGEDGFLTFLSKGGVLVLLRQLRCGLGTLRLLPWVITGD